MKATRVRKTRWPVRCGLCGALALAGQRVGWVPAQEAELPALGWCHTTCTVQAQRKTQYRDAIRSLGG